MSNIITMIGKAPRQPEVPPFTPRINSDATDDLKALFVLSHHQAICHALNCIAELDGDGMVLALLADLKYEFQQRLAAKEPK